MDILLQCCARSGCGVHRDLEQGIRVSAVPKLASNKQAENGRRARTGGGGSGQIAKQPNCKYSTKDRVRAAAGGRDIAPWRVHPAISIMLRPALQTLRARGGFGASAKLCVEQQFALSLHLQRCKHCGLVQGRLRPPKSTRTQYPTLCYATHGASGARGSAGAGSVPPVCVCIGGGLGVYWRAYSLGVTSWYSWA